MYIFHKKMIMLYDIRNSIEVIILEGSNTKIGDKKSNCLIIVHFYFLL